ncbi:MAG: hypothetical protein V3V81_04100 [Candidatus Bathyarchaeia archaeon]
MKQLEKKALIIKIRESEAFAKEIVWSIVNDFLDQVENTVQSGEYSSKCIEGLSDNKRNEIFRDGWRYITELTKKGLNTSILQDVFLVALGSESIVIERQDVEISVTPVLEDALSYLRDFCKGVADDKPVFLVDSYQPQVNFEKVFGRRVEKVSWGLHGGPLGTDKQQLVICDTAHWGAYNIRRDEKLRSRVESFIQDLLKTFPPETVLVVTTNKRMAKNVSHWGLPKEVRITWNRSDWMRGVTVENRRIMVCVGGPYLPKKAYVGAASSFDFKAFVKKIGEQKDKTQIAKILRIDDTRGEFINVIARVKDPRAEERSVTDTADSTKTHNGLKPLSAKKRLMRVAILRRPPVSS